MVGIRTILLNEDIRNIFFYIFSFLGLSMTRPIRNAGLCFPSGLPRQRGQKDVLSHTEFYTPIFCMLSVFQAIPFELPRKPPTVNRWDSTLCTPGWGQVLQSISSPNVKCAPETTARW